MRALVRFLAVVFAVSVIARFVASLWRALVRAPEQREAPPAGVTLVRDRVCNTFLPRERAVVATIDGHDEYFCSERCRSKALRDGGSGAPRVEP
jgi:hypothetical protein